MNYQVKRYLSKSLSIIHAVVPSAKKLPFRYIWNNVLGELEPELIHLEKFIDKREVAIDIGANYGLYSLRLSQLFRKCHAFELNPAVVGDLKSYPFTNFTLHEVGLGAEPSSTMLRIPLDKKGRELSGWGTLETDSFQKDTSIIEKEVRIATLDSFELKDVSFIKVDVEGHELKVLEGAIHTISIHRPVILIEVKDTNLSAVRNFFTAIKYSERSIESYVDGLPKSENFIYTPN